MEGKFCKLNAVLTFREYLNDYASAETRRIGEQLIEKELREIEGMSFFTDKKLLPTFRIIISELLPWGTGFVYVIGRRVLLIF